MTEPRGERGRQGAAPLGGTPDIETLRAGVVVMHDVTGRLETVFPDEAALDRIERAVEAAKALQYASQSVRFVALREALGALDG